VLHHRLCFVLGPHIIREYLSYQVSFVFGHHLLHLVNEALFADGASVKHLQLTICHRIVASVGLGWFKFILEMLLGPVLLHLVALQIDF
jgi:hypothetical protein